MSEYIDVHTFQELDDCILKGLENLRLLFNPIGMIEEISPEATELICENIYHVSDWDVSKVTNMEDMFKWAESFNQPLNNWDVSNVTNMWGMFYEAESFNQPLGKWDVSNVLDMRLMFLGADSFDQPLNNWDVSNVTEMGGMFFSAKSFNQPLNKWNVSKVTKWYYFKEGSPLTDANTPAKFREQGYIDVHCFQQLEECILKGIENLRLMFNPVRMFKEISHEARGLINNNKYIVSGWDMSNVTDMRAMFYDATSFSQPLNSWDVSNVTDMRVMFAHTKDFNQPLNNWDVSNVRDMSRMFKHADSFNQPLDRWDVSNVTSMRAMFERAKSFNQPLNNWDTSNVTDMSWIFHGARILQSTSKWASLESTLRPLAEKAQAMQELNRKLQELAATPACLSLIKTSVYPEFNEIVLKRERDGEYFSIMANEIDGLIEQLTKAKQEINEFDNAILD